MIEMKGGIRMYRQRVSSIPPNTSTGPNRSSKVSSVGQHIQSASSPSGDAGQQTWQPARVSQKRKNGIAGQVINLFPEQAEPYVEEDNEVLTIIIEFAQHNLEQIQWNVEGSLLIIESAIFICPYHHEIKLPDWAKEPSEVKLHNGLLIIRFENKIPYE